MSLVAVYSILAKPGYWGSSINSSAGASRVAFSLCPSGYCCGEPDSSWPCTAIDTCSNNRQGVLCGSCLPGYGEAFGSTRCVPDEQCNDAATFWGAAMAGLELVALVQLSASGLFKFHRRVNRRSGMASLVFYFLQVGGSRVSCRLRVRESMWHGESDG